MNDAAVCDVGLRWTGDNRAGSVKVVTALWLAGTILGCSACGEPVGFRLHRECESIVDTADRVSSPLLLSTYDIIDVLAKDPKVRRELGNAYYDKWQKYRDDHPDEWKAAYGEVVRVKQADYAQNGRPKKVADCVLQRGMKQVAR